MSMGQGPDFFVIGAQKSATTTLYRAMAQHPGIYVPPIKEPNFYCRDINAELLERKGGDRAALMIVETEAQLRAYLARRVLSAHVMREDLYLSLFRDAAPGQLKGDFSVNYLYSEQAAGEIRASLRNPRVIAVIRNPIERAFSQYAMNVMQGAEIRGFSEAIAEEMARPAGAMAFGGYGYLARGLYYQQLKRYLDCFPRDHLLVVDFDDLVHRKGRAMASICAFLGLPEMPFDVAHEFAASSARFPALHRFLMRSGLRTCLGAGLPGFLKDRLRRCYYKQGYGEEILDGDLQRLRQFFRSDVQSLGAVLGVDYMKWIDSPTSR